MRRREWQDRLVLLPDELGEEQAGLSPFLSPENLSPSPAARPRCAPQTHRQRPTSTTKEQQQRRPISSGLRSALQGTPDQEELAASPSGEGAVSCEQWQQQLRSGPNRKHLSPPRCKYPVFGGGGGKVVVHGQRPAVGAIGSSWNCRGWGKTLLNITKALQPNPPRAHFF